MLLLEGIPADFNIEGSPYVYDGIAIIEKQVECAGIAYQRYCERFSGQDESEEERAKHEKLKKDAEDDADEDAKLRAAWEARRKEKEALSIEEEEENLYELLGIGHIGFAASDKQIKKAYQKAILIHHPDKLSAEEREKAEKASRDKDAEDPMFLKVQRAWEILSNKDKRRGYDSQFAFDEWIPTGEEPEEEFYEVYGPVFERNARFSVRKPVPMLGDDKTSMEKVRAFYRFWNRFESWREFSKFDEFKDGDIENAQSRYEKRWMMRQNEIIRTKKKKKEYERIHKLVALATEADPRLRRAKEAEEAAKKAKYEEAKAKKEAEEKAKREREEAERRRQEEEEKRLKEEAERERELRQQTKKAFKKQIRMLRKICECCVALLECDTAKRTNIFDAVSQISEWKNEAEEVSHLVEAFQTDDSCQVTDKAIAEKGVNGILDFLRRVVDKEKQAKEEEEERKRQLAREKEEERKRKNDELTQRPPWSADELSFLSKATKKFPGGSRNRWTMVANFINSMPGQEHVRTPQECIEQSKTLTNDIEQRKSFGTSEAAFKQFKQNVKKDESATDSNAAQEDADNWTPEQQSALEEALKKYPASMDKNERWKAIAKSVEGKTKKDCIARFKFLRQKILEKRENK